MDSDAIEEAAARWFVRRGSSGWSEADEAEFDAWLDAATAHRIEFIRVDAAWKRSARMQALGAGIPSGVVPERGSWGDSRFSKGPSAQPLSTFEEREEGHTRGGGLSPGRAVVISLSSPKGREVRAGRPRTLLLAAAASVLAVFAACYVYTCGYFAADRYTTPIGGLENVRLADGSRVTLNTDTCIRVRMTEHERHIDLVRGEAFFEVAKDPAHPFVVYVGDKAVMAVGTKFSVRRDSDDIEVVVTEGKVKLAAAAALPALEQSGSDGKSAHGLSADAEAGAPVLLLPGAIAKSSKTEMLVREHATSDTERLLSWRAGYVNFRDTTLSEAVAEFNRYNVHKIVVADPAIKAIRIGGNFRTNNTEAFLALLQNGFPIVAEKSADTVVLRAR